MANTKNTGDDRSASRIRPEKIRGEDPGKVLRGKEPVSAKQPSFGSRGLGSSSSRKLDDGSTRSSSTGSRSSQGASARSDVGSRGSKAASRSESSLAGSSSGSGSRSMSKSTWHEDSVHGGRKCDCK